MAKIDIVRGMDGTVGFVPSPLQAAVGDSVFWSNLDPQEQHWITLQGEGRNFWFGTPIAPFVNGQPADTTSEIILQEQLVYMCSLHPEETGEITVGAQSVNQAANAMAPQAGRSKTGTRPRRGKRGGKAP